ncbi:type II toxin-antitoxin system VapC family toxin [Rosistilla oblonga]|uniref:type II toxin-antitoxin system VapC family toxin n=1 Tax=Rosistilla oblonga TaxID=2527990 RepID=UPI0011A72CF4|nr:type II toxin-antitoxin system VapC family toxin [Rosistilla oblonga]
MAFAYVETTIVGNVAGRILKDPAAAAQQRLTRDWWAMAPTRLELVVSQLVVDECGAGDPTAARERLEAISNHRLLAITPECRELAANLISAKAVPASEPRDALHIAIASVHGVDYLLTWNFKHIANAVLRHQIEFVIREAGFEPPVICTPQELPMDETDD